MNCVNLERAPLKLQRSIMSKGEKKKGEGKKEGKGMGEPQAAVEFLFFQGQSDLQIAKLDVAPLNLKRAINFYKFKERKSFICRLQNLIEVVSRFK